MLNLAVAIAKLALGYITGAVSIVSDGFHSLTDAASNTVGLVGVHAASRPPDEDHPYGHRKYETVAAAAVTLFLLFVVVEVLRNAFNASTRPRRRRTRSRPASFVVMLVTLAVNLFVIRYESRAAKQLGSEVLLADALQTRGDVWTSVTVIAALAGARAGLPILDPIAAIVVAGFIGYAGFQIALATTGILSDRIVIPEDDARERVVLSVPGVLGCHHIRTRGTTDYVFLDLHVWLPPDMSLADAHALSHVVKDRLMARYPQIVDAIIHIEPPPRARRSLFNFDPRSSFGQSLPVDEQPIAFGVIRDAVHARSLLPAYRAAAACRGRSIQPSDACPVSQRSMRAMDRFGRGRCSRRSRRFHPLELVQTWHDRDAAQVDDA